jgi:hypothetical protein
MDPGWWCGWSERLKLVDCGGWERMKPRLQLGERPWKIDFVFLSARFGVCTILQTFGFEDIKSGVSGKTICLVLW